MTASSITRRNTREHLKLLLVALAASHLTACDKPTPPPSFPDHHDGYWVTESEASEPGEKLTFIAAYGPRLSPTKTAYRCRSAPPGSPSALSTILARLYWTATRQPYRSLGTDPYQASACLWSAGPSPARLTVSSGRAHRSQTTEWCFAIICNDIAGPFKPEYPPLIGETL